MNRILERTLSQSLPLREQSSISAVVIGRNEGACLSRCLESITRSFASNGEGALRWQGGQKASLIYVDSASTDDSQEIAASFGAEVLVLRATRLTAAMGRNAGWRHSQSDYVLFLDGDTVLHPDFLDRAQETFEKNPSAGAVWGNNREVHPEHTIFNRILDLDWIYPFGETEFCGGNVMMRRSVLVETGGYDSELIAGEEPDLCRRLRAKGYKILHIDCPMTGHDLQMTKWSQYWRRAIRTGQAYATLAGRYRDTHDPMWLAESHANLWHGGLWIATLVGVLSALAWSPWPLLAWVLLFILACARSAWKSSWKAPGRPVLLFFYGVHSHLQQIPIMIGQLQVYLGSKSAGAGSG